MQSGSKPVSQWSDVELQTALMTLGCAVARVPVTPTTRPMLEKTVERLLVKERQDAVQDKGAPETRDKRESSSVGSSPEGNRNSPNVQAEDEKTRAGFEGFYGVTVNAEGTTAGGTSLSPFYTTKSDALRAIKSIPGARFKKFSNQASAEAFSNSPSSSSFSSPNSAGNHSPASGGTSNVAVGDKPNLFASLKPPDLSKLRGVVESGDVSVFSHTVWSNPRYLVNCYSDTPEILQYGCRYNALHCAVRAGKLEICQELMSILHNPDFWKLVYPNDCPESVLRRRMHLIDLYLNMQDKIVGETPLHYACKLGHLEIVRFLLSQPSLDTTLTNKYNKTAADIVCDNAKSSSTALRDKISDLMKAPPIYYVPVLRSTDNCTPPQLTPPCTIAEYHLHQRALSDDRGTPVIGQAFAGPMSPVQADEFYREWRSPSNSRDWREALQIKRADSSRGFERVGRQLAEQRNVGWQEYWEFLGCYCDLRTNDGLEKLEQYLAPPTTPPHQQSPRLTGTLASPMDTNTVVNEKANISRELFPREDCEATKDQNVIDSDTAGEGDEGVMEGEEGEEEVDEGGHGMRKERGRRGVESNVIRDSGDELESVLKGMASLSVSGGGGGGEEGKGEGGEEGEGEGSLSQKEEITSNMTVKRNSSPPLHAQTFYHTQPVLHEDNDGTVSEDKWSNSLSLCSSVTENKATARRNAFLLGHEPTKLDRDVYMAVKGAPGLSATHYPSVVEWINSVKGFSEHAQKSWKTPRSSWKRHSLHDSEGGRGDTPTRTLVSPILVTSPPQSPLSRPPILPSPHSPSHRLHTSTLSPRRHFSPLHRSLNASSTPSRLHRSTSRPRQVLLHDTADLM